MEWIENGVWILALIASAINLIYLIRFKNTESGDERGSVISGRSAIYSFAILSGLISFLILFDLVFDFSAEHYRLSIGFILMFSNAFSVISHNYVRKQY
jgi:hypothetical protein